MWFALDCCIGLLRIHLIIDSSPQAPLQKYFFTLKVVAIIPNESTTVARPSKVPHFGMEWQVHSSDKLKKRAWQTKDSSCHDVNKEFSQRRRPQRIHLNMRFWWAYRPQRIHLNMRFWWAYRQPLAQYKQVPLSWIKIPSSFHASAMQSGTEYLHCELVCHVGMQEGAIQYSVFVFWRSVFLVTGARSRGVRSDASLL